MDFNFVLDYILVLPTTSNLFNTSIMINENIELGIAEINHILKKRNLTFWNSEWFGIGEIKEIKEIYENVYDVDRGDSVQLTSETKKGLLKII